MRDANTLNERLNDMFDVTSKIVEQLDALFVNKGLMAITSQVLDLQELIVNLKEEIHRG
jgi:hypothetical protein